MFCNLCSNLIQYDYEMKYITLRAFNVGAPQSRSRWASCCHMCGARYGNQVAKSSLASFLAWSECFFAGLFSSPWPSLLAGWLAVLAICCFGCFPAGLLCLLPKLSQVLSSLSLQVVWLGSEARHGLGKVQIDGPPALHHWFGEALQSTVEPGGCCAP